MSNCALCHRPLTPGERFFKTAGGGWFLADHKYHALDDAPIHWTCFDRWPERPEFGAAYLAAWSRVVQNKSNAWRFLEKTDDYFLWINTGETFSPVQIQMAETGTGFQVPLCAWDDVMADPTLSYFDDRMNPTEWQALQQVVYEIKQAGWSKARIIEAVNKNETRKA